ncbi:hypothetical protein [Hippea maritima]|uniref:Uncharacterized protein n=1 Tax=Hippea maritima (strain ATCC 700847 / DSM 10411 / MH2) TaxID=760142 RepID=F2LU46_HIPMA|nr:hypothetical protein [Hippea maritima]AEA34509.1 hypothetical protein Hipma_1553 [Hippea maritima DSM 10411]
MSQIHTYKVLALVIYRDEKKLVTTNIVRAKDKKDAKKQIERKYMKLPEASEVIINEELDIIQLV